MSPAPVYDLASLAKALVTAPLAHAFLDLDADRRFVLGFHDRAEPLTVRQLLSHSAGLPPWRPFTGEPLADQLRRPAAGHPLLRNAAPGVATYSDLGYRLLAELLEAETGVAFPRLGAALSGLVPAPWPETAVAMPDGPDADAWCAAEPGLPLPPPDPRLPHDLNARAGMQGHAGFAATEAAFARWLRLWASHWAPRLAMEATHESDGSLWGLGLRVAHGGSGRFAELLKAVPMGAGIQVAARASDHLSPAAPPLEARPGPPSGWWCHFGFTGPAVFFRPADGACLGLLLHRRGPRGELLDAEALRARRWELLAEIAAKL
ncbi:MAG TPA: serine hydrolase domain-containing protein [Holophagaceae bacterium]|nr:serine hydrolase domain-containing protein [Holophagaceae bacterium]